jgi:hypothetical protein
LFFLSIAKIDVDYIEKHIVDENEKCLRGREGPDLISDELNCFRAARIHLWL